uniref:CSON013154 protein n=2 Tax=Culicoides sonorensis TaxID=179676 RepID=A0A336MB58_CULSO
MVSENALHFSWLTTEFLINITKTKHDLTPQDKVTIKSFETSYASAKGDNYLGTVFRLETKVMFHNHDNTDYYIIKTTDGEVVSGSNAMADEFKAYQIEMEMYELILPALEKLWLELGNENVKFGPRCYGVFRKPFDIIVLEDLKQEGFFVLDRLTNFNMIQVKEIIKWLAKFHAASVVYVWNNGPLSSTFKRGMFCKEFIGKCWGTHFDNLYRTFTNLIREWPNFKNISEKLEKFGDCIYQKCCNSMEVNSSELNVLNHGDTWITNVLLSTNHDNLKHDIRLIDFQFSSWGSPAQDLWFLISTSINIEDRINNFDIIIQYYYKTLTDSFIKLKYEGNIPTFEDFQQDLMKRGVLGLGVTTESFAAISIDKGMQINFETVARDDHIGENFRKKIFNNPRFIETSRKYLEFLDMKGIFEFLQARLKRYFKDDSIKITSLIVKPASGKGDGYAGLLLRASVSFTSQVFSMEEKTSFIIKTIVWDELTSKTQKVYNIVKKEIYLYENVLPKIKNLLTGINVKGDIFPSTISTEPDNELIIMEDLNLKKYIMLDRLKGLPDRAHLMLFLKRLAQVHAASAVLYEKDKSIYKKCSFGMFNRSTDVYHIFFYGFFDALCNEVGRWFGYGYYAEKLKAMRSTLIENACRVYDNDENDFCVLTHGDMWINNIMFNYHANGVPKDCVLYGYYGTPFIDLLLFLISSTDNDTRINHEEYIQYYYKNLKIVLLKLGYKKKIPTLFEFRQQYIKKSFLKITSMFIMTPIMTNDLGDMADLEALLINNERSKKFAELCMKRPDFQETIKRILPVFDREGLLDPIH